MSVYKEKVQAYLAVPEDKTVLEEQFFERSAELLQINQYLAEKGLLLDYELAVGKAELKHTISKDIKTVI